jgi:uncharacterized membrane protein
MNDLPISDSPPAKSIAVLSLAAPWQWLRAGCMDLARAPATSLFYGIAFWLMARALALVFQASPEYTMSIASGCLLLGPFLALGLYDVSRSHDQGVPPRLLASLVCWKPHVRSMGMLVLVLMVLELLWGRASLVVFAVFFNTGMPSTLGVVQAIFNPENLEFLVAYTLVGGAFATLVFAISVVSIPMILDRDTDAISASITSLEVVFANPAVMLVWGATLTTLIVVSLLLPCGLGLLLIGPLLGHASWHAYRGAVHWHGSAEKAAN